MAIRIRASLYDGRLIVERAATHSPGSKGSREALPAPPPAPQRHSPGAAGADAVPGVRRRRDMVRGVAPCAASGHRVGLHDDTTTPTHPGARGRRELRPAVLVPRARAV